MSVYYQATHLGTLGPLLTLLKKVWKQSGCRIKLRPIQRGGSSPDTIKLWGNSELDPTHKLLNSQVSSSPADELTNKRCGRTHVLCNDAFWEFSICGKNENNSTLKRVPLKILVPH